MRPSRPLIPPDPCPICRAGLLKLDTANLLTFYGDVVVKMAHVPVWKCDLCRYQETDPSAAQRLNALVSQSGIDIRPIRAVPMLRPRLGARI